MQDELAASLGELLKHTSGHTSPSLGCMVKPSPHPSPRRPGTPRLHVLLHALEMKLPECQNSGWKKPVKLWQRIFCGVKCFRKSIL